MAVQSIKLTFSGIELFRAEGLSGSRQLVVGKSDTVLVNSIVIEAGTCQHCGSKHPAGRVVQFTFNGRLAFSAVHDDGDAGHVASVINTILNGKEFIEAVNTLQQEVVR